MKKILVALLTALVITFACFGSAAFAESDTANSDIAQQSDLLSADAFVQQLCSLNKAVADADSVQDTALAKENVRLFLLQQMRSALGNDTPQAISFGEGDTGGYNIEGKLDVVGTDKCIVVGAHYDTVGEGAMDNAVGVAVLLAAAKQLADNKGQLPFDVYFVAFDCEEAGMIGSQYYVNRIGGTKGVGLDNVMVMFNVDMVAVGNLYLMCENKHTELADLMLTHCGKLTEKPYAAGVYGEFDPFGYGYYESIQASDHTSFRTNGIPTALLFAGSYGMMGYECSSVVNTDADTYEYLVETNPEFAERIEEVSGVIVDTVLDEQFVEVAQNARGQLVNDNAVFNRWWPSLTVLGVLIILAVFTWLYYRKLQKKALLGTGEIKNETVFDKPKAEDIFSFDDSQKGGSDSDKSDVDGIFTFKK